MRPFLRGQQLLDEGGVRRTHTSSFRTPTVAAVPLSLARPPESMGDIVRASGRPPSSNSSVTQRISLRCALPSIGLPTAAPLLLDVVEISGRVFICAINYKIQALGSGFLSPRRVISPHFLSEQSRHWSIVWLASHPSSGVAAQQISTLVCTFFDRPALTALRLQENTFS